jgi:hypothetical protein
MLRITCLIIQRRIIAINGEASIPILMGGRPLLMGCRIGSVALYTNAINGLNLLCGNQGKMALATINIIYT